MTPDPLVELAADLHRRGLRAPVALLLDAVRPLDIVNSQLARFSLPFLSHTGAEPVASALCDAAGWQTLRCLLEEQPRT
jgi:hypothetical protein